MTTRWNPPAALTSLLEALESDLLGAHEEDVQAALNQTGRADEGAICEIKLLLSDIEEDSDDRVLLPVPPDGHSNVGIIQRH